MGKYLKGRTNRATFWLLYAVVVALYGGVAVIAGKPPGMAEFVLILLAVPRLHDIDATGWLAVGPIVAEFVLVWALLTDRIRSKTRRLPRG